MKSKLSHFFKSFSFKLSCIVTVVVTIIFVILAYIIRDKVEATLNREAMMRTQNSINDIIADINSIINEAQTVAANSDWVIVDANNNHADMKNVFNSVTNNIVTTNKAIGGAVISAIPGAVTGITDKYATISYIDNNSNLVNSPIKYDYTAAEWYCTPIAKNSDYWTEPFHAKQMGQLVTSISHIIYDKNSRKQLALLTIDIRLDNLKAKINKKLPFANSYAMLVSQNGHFIVHPDNNFILKHADSTIFTDEKYKYDTVGKIARISNYSGDLNNDNNIENSQLFFCTIPSTGWKLIISCPFSDVYSKARESIAGMTRMFIICLMIMIIICFVISHYATRPLRLFTKSLAQVGSGDYNTKLPNMKGFSELEKFHDSFTDMQESLKENIIKLTETTKAQERVNSELHIAKVIQQDLLTKAFSPFVECPNLDLFASLKPAREVGGDLYDFFITEQKLYFTIGDVSGKGIPASLFMAITRGLFRVIAYGETSPGIIAEKINKTLAMDNSENMFVTMFIGVLDLNTGKMLTTNAGHNSPIITTATSKCSFLETNTNLPIGCFEDTKYVDQELQLAKGDLFFLYTDGITEAENIHNQLFGDDRLLAEVDKYSGLPTKQLIIKITESVSAFANGAEQSDDITALCLRLLN